MLIEKTTLPKNSEVRGSTQVQGLAHSIEAVERMPDQFRIHLKWNSPKQLPDRFEICFFSKSSEDTPFRIIAITEESAQAISSKSPVFPRSEANGFPRYRVQVKSIEVTAYIITEDIIR